MHISASTQESHRRQVRPVAGWSALPSAGIAGWNERLLGTGASLFQLPYWNEALRVLRFEPRYLVYRENGDDLVYACVLGLGVRGLRVGLVQRGPVPLRPKGEIPERAWQGLLDWARHHGYVFLRFTHSDGGLLDRVAALDSAHRVDAFPFYHEPTQDLLVPQRANDEEMLASFQPVCRRNIRKASAVGYQVDHTDSPEDLAALWPLFESVSRRKRFSFRPRESFLSLLNEARPHGGARVYTARLDGRVVQALVLVRDGDTVHNVIGALDVAAIDGHTSPSELLHWNAMRDFAALGVRYYNLGTRSGAVYEFKRKFRPMERTNPPPVTVVVNPLLYPLWSGVGLTLAGSVWPRVKRTLSRSGSRSGSRSTGRDVARTPEPHTAVPGS